MHLLQLVFIANTLYFLSHAVYNIFFHPLARFPGPHFHAASRIPRWLSMWRGNVRDMKKLHDRYGNVVRIAPDVLSFNTAQAWKDICGIAAHKRQVPKDFKFYEFDGPDTPRNIVITLDDDDHARHRRLLAHAFSTQALKEQEPLITRYFNLLMKRLSERAEGGSEKVDLVLWYSSATHDILGDLAFDEPFGALDSESRQQDIQTAFEGLKWIGRVLITASMFPLVKSTLDMAMRFIPALGEARRKQTKITEDKVSKRFNSATDRKDFMYFVTRNNANEPLSHGEIVANMEVLTIGGTETSATLLSGATWLLLKNPETLRKLTEEIHGTFTSEEEMTISTCQRLPYLRAVVEESLRWYPPGPGLMPRRTDGETVIDGWVVPSNTAVGVHQWSAHHSSKNFRDAEKFVPERWLDDPRYVDDKKEAMQAFSTGPRNCIGKNLAYAEIMSILTRVFFRFDVELCPESDDWMKGQAAWIVWDKPALWVKLRERGTRQ